MDIGAATVWETVIEVHSNFEWEQVCIRIELTVDLRIPGNRPHWGDCGAVAVDGQQAFLAGQTIEQPTCSLTDFIDTGFTCWGTRTSLANWSTRVRRLKP